MTGLDPHIARALEATPTAWGSSRWGEYRRCQRAHQLRYHLRIAPRKRGDTDTEWDGDDASYFDVGQLVHAVFRYTQEAVMRDTALDDWPRVLQVGCDVGFDLGAVYEAERLMGAYWLHYGLDNAGWPDGTRILSVEEELSAIIGGRPYTSRADAILRLPSGEIVVVDHKTRGSAIPGTSKSRPDAAKRDRYARGLATRPQFAGLSWLTRKARHLSDPVNVWVNAIVKTTIPQFERLTVEMTENTLDWWYAVQERTAIDAGEMLGGACNPSECAPEMGSRCWAFLWCHGTLEERERYYERRTPPQETI